MKLLNKTDVARAGRARRSRSAVKCTDCLWSPLPLGSCYCAEMASTPRVAMSVHACVRRPHYPPAVPCCHACKPITRPMHAPLCFKRAAAPVIACKPVTGGCRLCPDMLGTMGEGGCAMLTARRCGSQRGQGLKQMLEQTWHSRRGQGLKQMLKQLLKQTWNRHGTVDGGKG